MTEQPSHPANIRPRRPVFIWSWIFALVALEGAAAVIILARLPSDAAGQPLGFSTSRLGLMALLLGGALIFALLAWQSRRNRLHLPHWMKAGLLILLPLVGLVSGLVPLIMLSLYRTGGDYRYLAYSQRLLPLFTWLLLAGLEIFGGLACCGGFHWQSLRAQRSVWQAGLAAWGLFGLASLFVALTGIGIVPDRVGWGLPTVSLMEWQIWLAWALGSAFLLWLAYRGWNARQDWLLAGAIWLLAAGLWISQPIRPAFFATAGRAPNYEIYPFSDGAYYGLFTQSLLIGNGFKGGEIPARPLYITLLAGFHLLAGQKYENVIAIQTLLLAFFPVCLFLLGKALHSRAAGLLIALLAIFREVTAIIAMPITDNASNSKLFFADLPTALAVSLWALVVVLWLKSAGRRPWLAFAAGGSLGVAMLFRTQSMFMLPAVLLVALIVYRNGRRWLRPAALLGLGLALVLAPWLWRNWTVTGRLAFDDDKSQTGSMAQRYSLSGVDERFVYQPGEDPGAYSKRVTQGIFSFLRAHPDVVAGFVSGHWFNAEIANVLVLPIRSGIASLQELVVPIHASWQNWNGSLGPWQAVLFATNLGLISLGLGACWIRSGWPGVILLLINLSYNFSNALARNSGGRYLLVVDWVIYGYAAVGLMEITIAGLSILGVSPERISPLLAQRANPADSIQAARPGQSAGKLQRLWLPWASAGLAFLLVGALPLLAERAIPDRYPDQTRAALVAETLQNKLLAQPGLDLNALSHFIAQPQVAVIQGRALYPRFYAAGQGEPLTAKTGYEPLDYARTVFLITSKPYNGLAIFKSPAIPAFFPNSADVIVIGCQNGTYLDARLVLVLTGKGGAYLSSGEIPQSCPVVQNQALSIRQ